MFDWEGQQKLLRRKFIKNVGFAFVAQGVSFFLSMTMSLIVPKILGEIEFAYWQLFIFYANYVGLFHLGITDGVYLKYGGYEYADIDKPDVRFQLSVLTCWLITFSLLMLVLVNNSVLNGERKIILFLTNLYMIVANMAWYLGYIFQASNRIKEYSISVILDRLLFLMIVIVSLILGKGTYMFFIVAYIVTKLLAVIYSFVRLESFWKGQRYSTIAGLSNTLYYIKNGIFLTLSSVASILILGIGRFIIDGVWGIDAFSKISLSLSLTNFFLLFVGQVSLVLFPSLRRFDESKQKEVFEKCQGLVNLFLPLILVLYVPLKNILLLWLPDYELSFRYLGLLLPLCLLDGKMQLLCNTYFKVFNKQRILLLINLCSMFISMFMGFIGAWGIRNMNFVVFGLVISIAVRSIVSEIYLNHCMKSEKRICKDIAFQIILITVFMASSWYLADSTAFAITFVSYIFFICFSLHKIYCAIGDA